MRVEPATYAVQSGLHCTNSDAYLAISLTLCSARNIMQRFAPAGALLKNKPDSCMEIDHTYVTRL